MRFRIRLTKRLAALALPAVLWASTVAAAQPCERQWLPGHRAPGLDAPARAAVTHDEGQGPVVFIGGEFGYAGDVEARHIVRWDGQVWSDVGGGVNGPVDALIVHEGRLIVAGEFTEAGGVTVNHIAAWDGAAWSALGGGTDHFVRTVTAHDGDLYAGGLFQTAGEASARFVARWDGERWSALGTGVNNAVRALASYSGDLVVGGFFLEAGGEPAKYIARWDGSAWQTMGELNSTVRTLTIYEGDLVAAGDFRTAGWAYYIARWDGGGWSQLGLGVDRSISTLAVHDGELFAGGLFGRFDFIGSPRMPNLIRWDGASWHAVEGRNNGRDVRAMVSFDDELVVVGDFVPAPGIQDNVATWRPERGWRDIIYGLGGAIDTFATFDDRLVAGGRFVTDRGEMTIGVIEWDGVGWRPFGDGIEGFVKALVPFDGGLAAAGEFIAAGGKPALNVAWWDGATWQSLGEGLEAPVVALEVHEGALYAAGEFPAERGPHSIARWTGSAWELLPDHLIDSLRVRALLSWKGQLYAGGWQRGSAPSDSSLQVWDGARWTIVGGKSASSFIHPLYDDGERLLFGGAFVRAGELVPRRVASWDGTAYGAFGSGIGVTGGAVEGVVTLGDDIVAIGRFDETGARVPASNAARFDGEQWVPMEEGLNSSAFAAGRHGGWIAVAGWFTTAGPQASAYFARWGCRGCLADFDGSGGLDLFDFLRFQELFAAEDPAADIDGDGAFTFFDFLAFQELFAEGCG